MKVSAPDGVKVRPYSTHTAQEGRTGGNMGIREGARKAPVMVEGRIDFATQVFTVAAVEWVHQADDTWQGLPSPEHTGPLVLVRPPGVPHYKRQDIAAMVGGE